MIKFVSPYEDSFEQSYKKVSFFNVQEDLLVNTVNPKSSRALGFVHEFVIPAYWRNPIDKIPSSIEIPSGEEIIAFFKIFKGIRPYDPDNVWKKKMFNWDIYTHEKEHLYMQEMLLLENKDSKAFN